MCRQESELCLTPPFYTEQGASICFARSEYDSNLPFFQDAFQSRPTVRCRNPRRGAATFAPSFCDLNSEDSRRFGCCVRHQAAAGHAAVRLARSTKPTATQRSYLEYVEYVWIRGEPIPVARSRLSRKSCRNLSHNFLESTHFYILIFELTPESELLELTLAKFAYVGISGICLPLVWIH